MEPRKHADKTVKQIGKTEAPCGPLTNNIPTASSSKIYTRLLEHSTESRAKRHESGVRKVDPGSRVRREPKLDGLFDFEVLDSNMRKRLNLDREGGGGGGEIIDLSSPVKHGGIRDASSSKTVTPIKSNQKSRARDPRPRREEEDVSHRDDVYEKLLLSSWGLPEPILRRYERAGIVRLFEWQAECLCTGRVLERGNLVYSAPTSAGKTMVAELLMLKSVVETGLKALFIFPFVSVAREKCQYLQRMFQDAGIRVGGYFGGSSPAGGFASVDIGVCTIEKANNLVNRLLEEESLDQLGCVVVDELHMVGDRHRGYLLELLVTKIRYVASLAKVRPKKQQKSSVEGHPPNNASSPSVQIVGMSATLPNLNLLANWLDADLFTSDFRPVPLLETVKVGPDLFDSGGSKIRTMGPSRFRKDEDHVIQLCSETVVEDRCSVLIFCPTKNWCETLADTIAREFYEQLLATECQNGDLRGSKAVEDAEARRLELSERDLLDVLELLRRSPSGLDPGLGKMIRCGVAYHHAGLTFEERDIIEGAFRSGALKVLVATSTLSSGVNLPARRVIVRTPMFHGACVDALVYKQMVGRAGRKGVDTKGESVLICKASERRQGFELLNAQLPPITSCLHFDPKLGLGSSMKRAVLEIIVSRVASKKTEVEQYARCTMLAASLRLVGTETGSGARPGTDPVSACVEYLVENEFVQVVKDPSTGDDSYAASQLGQAVVASGLSPEEGIKVFVELQRSSRCFVLENDLHLVYLVTPMYMLDQFSVDWYHFLRLWEGLTSDLKRVGEVVGVQDRFISRAVGGKFNATSERSVERLVSIHKRFYMALALYDLINESPLTSVCTKFKVNKGALQALQQSSSTFAGMVTSFVGKLGWRSMEALLIHFQSRLSFGVQQELVDLVRIPALTARLARCLYSAGYVNVASLALASPDSVAKVLRTESPFLSKKKAEGESEWELEERLRTSRCVFVNGGGGGMTEREAAVEIVSEARRMVAGDLLKMGIRAPIGGATEGERAEEEEEEERGKSRPPNSKRAKIRAENPAPTSDSQSSSSLLRTSKKKQQQRRRTRQVAKKRRSWQISGPGETPIPSPPLPPHSAILSGRVAAVDGSVTADRSVSILTPPRSFLDSRKKETKERGRKAEVSSGEIRNFIEDASGSDKPVASAAPATPRKSERAGLEAGMGDASRGGATPSDGQRLRGPGPIDTGADRDPGSSTAARPGGPRFNPFLVPSEDESSETKQQQQLNLESEEMTFGERDEKEEVDANEEDSRFSDDTQFRLFVSRESELAKTRLQALDEPKGPEVHFDEDILAGSQLVEEFLRNTFDSNPTPRDNHDRDLEASSTPKVGRPPVASTPAVVDRGSLSTGGTGTKTRTRRETGKKDWERRGFEDLLSSGAWSRGGGEGEQGEREDYER